MRSKIKLRLNLDIIFFSKLDCRYKAKKYLTIFEKTYIMTEKEKESAWLELKRKKAKKKQIDDYYKDIKGIRQNVQYFFWVSIISIISTILVLLG